ACSCAAQQKRFVEPSQLGDLDFAAISLDDGQALKCHLLGTDLLRVLLLQPAAGNQECRRRPWERHKCMPGALSRSNRPKMYKAALRRSSSERAAECLLQECILRK